MLGEVCFAIAMVPETLLVALDRGFQSLLLRCITVGGGTSASWWALSHGHGLRAVAGCMCAAQAGGALIVGLIAAHAIKISPLRYLVAAFAPVFYALAALAGGLLIVPASLGRFGSVLIELPPVALSLLP